MNTLQASERILTVATSPEVLARARTHPAHFTRNRTMPFHELLLFLLNPAKECLQTRLNNFFKTFGKRAVRMTQQAVSKARSHFDHSPFEEMTRRLVADEYGGEFPLETWNGYHVFAIDGSYVTLPNTPELRETFGANGPSNACAAASISILYDVLHDWIVDASILHFPQNERESAKAHINYLQTQFVHLEKKLILLDRGYPSVQFLAYLQKEGLAFLCRCQRHWVTSVNAAPMGDSVCTIGDGQRVRVYKFVLPSGQLEILLTNLFDVPASELPEIYFLRWGVEGKYDVLKNKVQLENFSGYTPNTIRQDFWVSITLTILVTIAKKEADELLQTRIADKPNRRKQSPNVSQLVASLKDDFIHACTRPSPRARKLAINRIIHEISRSISTIRPERPPRHRSSLPKKKQSPINRKSNI